MSEAEVLDAGALGVICPMVNSGEDAAAFVSAMRYPPLGRGGWLRGLRSKYFRVLRSDRVLAAGRSPRALSVGFSAFQSVLGGSWVGVSRLLHEGVSGSVYYCLVSIQYSELCIHGGVCVPCGV